MSNTCKNCRFFYKNKMAKKVGRGYCLNNTNETDTWPTTTVNDYCECWQATTAKLDHLVRFVWVNDLRRTWDAIALDLLAVTPGTLTAPEVREIVSDYVNDSDWWEFSPHQRKKLLTDAFPTDKTYSF